MENYLSVIFDPSNQIYQLLVAVFLGIFIGLRREMLFQKEGIKGIMGVRTISIFVLLGTLSTFFKNFPLLPLIVFIGIFIFMLIAYYNGVFNLKRIGLTSELLALVMFLVGVLVGQGEITLAIVVTVLVGVFTAYKKSFHSFAKNFSLREWSGALQLLVISAIILPLLPRKPLDPFGIFVPFDIWLLVILISSIAFFGYFFDKYFSKKKSVLITSLFGSLVSSTAVSTTLAGESKKSGISFDLLSAGLMLAVATMQIRIIVEILIFSGNIEMSFILPSLFMAGASLLFTLYFYKKSGKKSFENKIHKEVRLESPFKLKPAIQFAALFTIILFAIYFGKKYFNDFGAYFVAFLASFADADSVILSTLESAKKINMDKSFVSTIILIPVIVNTLVKSLYIFILGRKKFFKKTLLPILAVSLIGLLTFLIF